MPQRVALSVLTTFQRQAAKTLTALQKEVTQREQELAALKTEASRWQHLLQGPARGDGAATVPALRKRARPKRRRLDWSTIFNALPPRFTSKDLAQQSGKPLGQAYVYVSRWVKDKKVRKVKEGYQKVA